MYCRHLVIVTFVDELPTNKNDNLTMSNFYIVFILQYIASYCEIMYRGFNFRMHRMPNYWYRLPITFITIDFLSRIDTVRINGTKLRGELLWVAYLSTWLVATMSGCWLLSMFSLTWRTQWTQSQDPSLRWTHTSTIQDLSCSLWLTATYHYRANVNLLITIIYQTIINDSNCFIT